MSASFLTYIEKLEKGLKSPDKKSAPVRFRSIPTKKRLQQKIKARKYPTGPFRPVFKAPVSSPIVRPSRTFSEADLVAYREAAAESERRSGYKIPG